MNRRSMLAAIHIAKKDQGLDDDMYRAKLQLITGKRSAAEMSEDELTAVLAHMQPDAPIRRKGKASVNNLHGFMRALWISLYHLGAVDDRRDSALDAFVKRQTAIEKAIWLPPEKAFKVIEGLKEMCGRAGFEIRDREENRLPHKVQLIFVLLEKINQYEPTVLSPSKPWSKKSPQELDALAGELGARLRALRAQAK